MGKRLVWAEVVAVGPNVRNMEPGDQVLFNPEDRYEVEVRARTTSSSASATSTPSPPIAWPKAVPGSTSDASCEAATTRSRRVDVHRTHRTVHRVHMTLDRIPLGTTVDGPIA